MSSAMRLGRWIGTGTPSLCGRSLLLHLLLFDNNHITNRIFPNNSGSTTTPTIAKARAFSTSTTTTSFSSRNRIESSKMNAALEETSSSPFPQGTGYLDAVNAAALDEELMATPGFSLEQLMELAGLAVAEVVYKELESVDVVAKTENAPKKTKILWICGPGNNGEFLISGVLDVVLLLTHPYELVGFFSMIRMESKFCF